MDPDNRRPVNFEQRAGSLGSEGALTDLIENSDQGLMKQKITQKLSHLRAAVPELFLSGSYQPLGTGANGTRVCCYVRSHGNSLVAVAVQMYPSLEPTSEQGGENTSNFRTSGRGARLLTTH